MRSLFAALLALTGLLAAVPRLEAAPAELKRLRVLLVFGKGAEQKNSIDADEWRINTLLRGNIPRRQLDITTLRGNQATRDAVLRYYRDLKTSPDEALLFYSSGHGCPDARPGGPVIEVERGPALTRADVRRAMEAKKAGLVVLLSDGRNKPRRSRVARRMAMTVKPPTRLHPTLRCLFFQARDTVDITASGDGPAWGDEDRGGVFTRALCKVLESKLRDLDRDRDGLVTWKEIFPALQKETEVAFTAWVRERRNWGESIEGPSQKPLAYSLGRDFTQGEKAFAVVTIRNRTTKPMSYLYRWSDESRWQKRTIAPNGQYVHAQPLSTLSGEMIRLKVQVIGSSEERELKGLRWTGSGEPTPRDGSLYNFRTRKEGVVP
jgi:hypothetical protein